jgi:hypothetical protein
MRFRCKSVPILEDKYVGSGPGYVMRQVRYDLGAVQDHVVDVPFSSVFLSPALFGASGCFGLVLALPIGFVAMFFLFDKFPPLIDAGRTVGLVFLACMVVLYFIMGATSFWPEAQRAVHKQRTDGKKDLHIVREEDWPAFAANLAASTKAIQAEESKRKALDDALDRHNQDRRRPNY